ncbi:hypothetical protein JCM3263A_19110 [Thermobifida fusca]|jgi:hypothetical protein|uniref:Uncharacterized protein n=2 Tax=Thermobifida fusca TaxID=2021 RepID=A0A9P2T728_THEFU|nr:MULTISPECIES: hypothetical protein [Thermobifida]AAZ56902.1 hypothetical protein Tfu_2869 [Thermobifida fusca YX]EOR70014.1 hypothetical protein TM51_14741 [Thermobifida fusca TM51]MBO2529959.1 hypothetical protein [Thermobifida sp.]MDD6791943.1 hypothetical protein [Thermobifida fusca]PPS94528.1 hypothetical protein BH05_05350 [Thermobifida fusca]
MTSDLLSPSGPHPSLRRTTPSTVYRVAPDALPKRVRRGADGKLYGEVPLIPVPHDEGDQGVRNTRGGELDRQPPRSTAVPDLDGHDTRPDPLAATTPAEFVEAMRLFRRWAGTPSYRKMQQNCGNRCSATSFHTALSQDKLPKLSLVEAFIAACGGSDEEYRRWATAWRRLELRIADRSNRRSPASPSLQRDTEEASDREE